MDKHAVSYATAAGARTAADSGDHNAAVDLSLAFLPLPQPVSDAKVLTGRQRPLTEVAFVFAEITSRDAHRGLGFGYSKRAGGPGLYAHARELAPNLIGEDPNDIARLFTQLISKGSHGPARRSARTAEPTITGAWMPSAYPSRNPSTWSLCAKPSGSLPR